MAGSRYRQTRRKEIVLCYGAAKETRLWLRGAVYLAGPAGHRQRRQPGAWKKVPQTTAMHVASRPLPYSAAKSPVLSQSQESWQAIALLDEQPETHQTSGGETRMSGHGGCHEQPVIHKRRKTGRS